MSPVCPLGTNSVVASVDQNQAVSTSRNTEVISDATNVLALECVVRRQEAIKAPSTHLDEVHLAASHRFLRPKLYDSPAFSAHFHMFSLCSAGRDQGNLQFETSALQLQLQFYLTALQELLNESIEFSVLITDFHEHDRSTFLEKSLLAPIKNKFTNVVCKFNDERTTGRGYYQNLCFHIYATLPSGEDIQLADGGSVDWTQKLTSNRKERLIISGISSERICSLLQS